MHGVGRRFALIYEPETNQVTCDDTLLRPGNAGAKEEMLSLLIRSRDYYNKLEYEGPVQTLNSIIGIIRKAVSAK